MNRKTYVAVILAALGVIAIGCTLIAQFWMKFAEPKAVKSVAGVEDTLVPEVRAALGRLDTDYTKIRWGCEYTIIADFPGVVVSVTAYDPAPYHYLAVALTNVEEQEVIFSGDMQIKAADDSTVGSGFFFKEHIAPGQTVMHAIDCGSDKRPDGRIHWENVEMIRGEKREYDLWTANWSITKEPDFNRVGASINIIGETLTPPEIEEIDALLLDGEGNILSGARDFIHDIPLIGAIKDSVFFYIEGQSQDQIRDMAVFCSNRQQGE